jgi:hypothetical protein
VASRVSRPGGTLVEVSPPSSETDVPDTPDDGEWTPPWDQDAEEIADTSSTPYPPRPF